MGDARTVYQPIHPEMLPKLLPEYVDFHNANTAFARGIHELPWDPAIRKLPPVQGGSEPLKVGYLKDIPLSKCTMRVFTPEGVAPAQGWPVFIFFHGGKLGHSFSFQIRCFIKIRWLDSWEYRHGECVFIQYVHA